MSVGLEPPLFATLRTMWLVGTVAITALAIAAAALLGPHGEDRGGTTLALALFVGTSVHVASTGWFFILPEVRSHARRNPGRFLLAPPALIGIAAACAALASPAQLRWVLLGFLGWQFAHFHRQNLGLAALAARAERAGPLTRLERLALDLAAAGGVAGLLLQPDLLTLAADVHLPWAERVAFAVFATGVGAGLVALTRREVRPAKFVAMYLTALLFFAPVFCFDSSFPAVAGLTVAHGYQYLMLMALVSVAPRRGSLRDSGPALLSAIALGGGLVLAVVSHLHDSPVAAERALYGAFLGVVMAHFVLDAALWRLREEFPRRLLGEALPYLVRPDQPRRI